jgi:hypothetical protein
VHPKPLTIRFHHQQIAIGKCEFLSALALAMTKLQRPCGTKRKRRDRASGINLRFVIGMPTHAIVSIPIEIEQTTIELSRATLIHLLEQRCKPVRPTLALMHHTAVAV